MKKFSIIWYAFKFLLYIILSFIISFGGLGLLAFLLKSNYGTSLTMSFLGMMFFSYGFLNFFFFLFTPPVSQALKKKSFATVCFHASDYFCSLFCLFRELSFRRFT